jgi:hypothetical protein
MKKIVKKRSNIVNCNNSPHTYTNAKHLNVFWPKKMVVDKKNSENLDALKNISNIIKKRFV